MDIGSLQPKLEWINVRGTECHTWLFWRKWLGFRLDKNQQCNPNYSTIIVYILGAIFFFFWNGLTKKKAQNLIWGWANQENISSGYFSKFLNPVWFLNSPVTKLSLSCKHSFIVSVRHQEEGGIGKSIPDAREISRDPRNFSQNTLWLSHPQAIIRSDNHKVWDNHKVRQS